MWGRWCCSGGAFRSLSKRVSSIVNVTHTYEEKFHPFGPPLLGLRGVCSNNTGRGKGVEYLSVMLNQMKRGLCLSSSSSSYSTVVGGNGNGKDETISFSEAKKLMRLVNVESLKMKLGIEGKEVISYNELLQVCENFGIARNKDEASMFAKVLDEAGVVLLFRDKVYLHPDKV